MFHIVFNNDPKPRLLHSSESHRNFRNRNLLQNKKFEINKEDKIYQIQKKFLLHQKQQTERLNDLQYNFKKPQDNTTKKNETPQNLDIFDLSVDAVFKLIF